MGNQRYPVSDGVRDLIVDIAFQQRQARRDVGRKSQYRSQGAVVRAAIDVASQIRPWLIKVSDGELPDHESGCGDKGLSFTPTSSQRDFLATVQHERAHKTRPARSKLTSQTAVIEFALCVFVARNAPRFGVDAERFRQAFDISIDDAKSTWTEACAYCSKRRDGAGKNGGNGGAATPQSVNDFNDSKWMDNESEDKSPKGVGDGEIDSDAGGENDGALEK